ncbi:intermembrane lipid transfer protein Vps13D isoform X2 [Eurosta solidaginis]|uniref:intermembrane lipid transfer protein Vps13D isoform X2 n=1 Tax=Eurosta solidaginis TaxID=178769 RepID=UPI003530AEFD
MLNELISWVLNTYLGKYLEDFNPQQLSVALLSGEVELENVPIRKDALRSFGIPVQAQSGNIGKIKLQIPVRQFRTAPWCIIIERIYGVFGPKDLDDWDDEREKLAEYEFKVAELDAKEAKWRVENGYQIDTYYSNSYTSWLNYGTTLATNILQNLELKIKDVHIRYEDTLTVKGIQFAAGIKINSLTVQSCDVNWQATRSNTANDQHVSYKLIELKDFSLYWDCMTDDNKCSNLLSKDLLAYMNEKCDERQHHYLLHPIRASAHFKRECCKQAIRSKSKPRINCEFQVQEVKVTVSDLQYKQIADCAYGLRQINRTRKFKLIRPTCTVFENASLWWKYAAKCHGLEYQSSESKWLKLKENLHYMRIYKRLLINPNENITTEEKELKTQLEKSRELHELHALRNTCRTNVFTNDVNLEANTIRHDGKGMLFHWFPNWWGWYGNNTDGGGESNVVPAQDEAYKKMESDILNALEDTMENESFSKRDAIFCYFSFILVDVQLIVSTEDATTGRTTINFEMDFQNLISFIEMKPKFSSYIIGISLGSVCLKDKLTQNTEFPFLIKPQFEELPAKPIPPSTGYQLVDFKRLFMREQKIDCTPEPWFQLRYEKGPPDIQSGTLLVIKSRSLDIVYNKNAFDCLKSFFVQPINDVYLKYKLTKSNRKRLMFLQNWQQYLVGNEDFRTTWSLEIDISAPRIIFADNHLEKNTGVVLVDFGRFQMLKNECRKKESIAGEHDSGAALSEITSKLHKDSEEDDDDFMTPCSTPPGSEVSLMESPTLHQNSASIVNADTGLESAFHRKIYDKYFINLTDLQVIVCKNRERNHACTKHTSNFHLLEKFSICLELERRVIYTIDPDYPSLTLYGTLPKIVAHVNEQKLNEFFKILYPIITNGFAAKNEIKNDIGNTNKVHMDTVRLEAVTDGLVSEEIINGIANDFQSELPPNFLNTNLMVIQFVIGQMTLEVQSLERSIAELQVIGARAGITKRSEDTHISMSVHGLLLVDAIQSFGPDFELLVASHRHVGMDSISGSLKQSKPCSPTTPSSPDPMLGNDERCTSPHTLNRAINALESGRKYFDMDYDESQALINIDLNLIDSTEQNDSLQIANIAFNNLDIIANQETIVELLGFAKRLHNTHNMVFHRNHNFSVDTNTYNTNKKRSDDTNVNLRTEICFDFNRLNILVLRSINKGEFSVGRKVGTLTMSEAKIYATFGEDISVTGSLGGVQIIDITPEGINHQRIFSVGKDPLTNDAPQMYKHELLNTLTNELYNDSYYDTQLNALSFKIYCQKDSTPNLKIRMASVWYVHCPRFIQEINMCISQFKHYFKNFATSLRNKASDMASQLVQHIQKTSETETENVHTAGQISIDVVLNTPVLVLPRSGESLDVLVANLGKITAYNTHEENEISISKSKENLNMWARVNYFIDIRNINLFSLNTSKRKELGFSALPKVNELYACNTDAVPILHDTAMLFKLTNFTTKTKMENQLQLKNRLNVEGSITQCLQMSLSRSQYEQVLDTLNSYSKSRTSNSAHNESHVVMTNVDQPDSGVLPEDDKVNDEELGTAFEESYETNLIFSVPIFQIHLKNKSNNALIDVTFRDFSFQYNQQNDITNLEVLLRSIVMEDLKCAMDSRFRNMVDSTSTEKEIIYKTEKSLSCPNLTNIHLQQSELSQSMPCKLNHRPFMLATSAQTPVKKLHCGNNNATTKTSDDKLVTYKALTQIVLGTDGKPVSETKSSIDFNCLNLTISVSRWFTIFDFFGLVSTYEVKNTVPAKNELNEGEPISFDELKVSVRSLNLILVRNEIELSKVNISHAHFKIASRRGVKSIEGRLKSISLYDLTHFGDLYREKFSTSGPEALSFSYKRLNDNGKSNTRSLEMDAKLRIQMSSVRYIHTKRFIMEIHIFVKDLLELQSPVIRRIKMSESQANIDAKPIKIGLRIHAASPIVLLPLSYNSNQVIVADLGEFTLKNAFHFASDGNVVVSKRQDEFGMDEILDVMHIDLVNMNVFSGERIWKTNKMLNYNPCECVNIGNFIILKLGNNLFKETCHLKLQVERNTDTAVSHNCADITVKGVLTKLNAIINLQQYKLLRGFLSYNLGEMIDDVYDSYEQQNIYESIDKLNNVNETYNSADTLDMPIWTTMSINLQLENVSVSLADQQNYDDDNDEIMLKSLACINFIKSFLKIDTFSDGAQDIDLVSSEVLVLDTRPEQTSKNVFRHILKPKRDKREAKDIVQAEIHSRKHNNSSSKYTILLNNMRLMAILDCLESIKKFLEEEPTVSSTVTPTWRTNKIMKQTSQSTHESIVGSELKAPDTEIILNITDSEVIFVENVELADTNAIILKNTTVLQYKPHSSSWPLSIDVNHLEVFSCILGAEEESALSIIDPFSLNMELKNNCFHIIIHKQLSIRLSYNDVKLFSKMLQSIPNQTKTSQKNAHHAAKYANFEIVAPLISMGFKQKDCWEAMEVCNYNLNDAAMWLTQQKYLKTDKAAYLEVHDLLINANCISICIIDDCMDADVPLLEIALTQLTLAQHLCNDQSPNTTVGSGRSMPLYQEGRLETIFASDYYNRRLSGWEPVIEPWECSAHWQHTRRNVLIPKMLVMQVSSKQLLKMNITTTLLELCDIVRYNWIKDYYSQGNNISGGGNVIVNCGFQNAALTTACFRRRSPFVPFALKNLTGEPLLFKIHYAAPGGITRTEVNQLDIMCDWLAVEPNEILPFDFGPQNKLRHMNSHKLNTHQILVQIQGWTLIGPISIDKVGVFFRYATLDMQYKKRTRIVFDISMFGSAQKMITIRSALTVVNRLNARILLKMEVKHEHNVALSVLEANAQLSVPLRLVDSLIYFRPYTANTVSSSTNTNSNPTNKTIDDLVAHATNGKTIFVRKNSILCSNRCDDLEFSTCGISWTSCSKDSVDELFSCYGKNKAVFYTLVEIRKAKYPNRDLNTPGHTITLLPPLKLRNMLSCDLLFKVSGHIQGRINSSEVVNIHTINACDSFVLSITLDNYKLSGQLKIPMGHTGIVEPKLKLIDILNRELYLRVSIQSFQGKGMEIFISAPIWILNRTGLPLVYRQEGTNRIGSGQFDEHEQARIVSPLLFSFSDQEGSPSLEIRLGNSYGNNNPWCKSFNIHKETYQRQLRAERYKGCYAIGINIRRGRGLYSWTTFIILSPRYQLYNKSTRKLEFSQKCDIKKPDSANAEHIISAMPGSNFPFHWPNYEQEPLLCVRISDVSFCHWSHGIPINEVHSIYINIRNDLGEMFFLRLEVISKGATYFFIFSDANSLPPPIRIDNYSEIIIHFYQYGCKPHWRCTVRSQSSLAYALDDPLGAHMLQIEAPGGNSIEFPLNKMGNSNSITYANFIYIAFKETFAYTENEMSQLGIEGQQLVLAVRDKKVIVAHKCTGDRSQLWLMNSFGQLEHEGSSPPTEFVGKHNESTGCRMVLDVETALNPNDYTNLVVRPPNKQRVTTQRWRFENGRLMCHTNMCVQVRNGVFGLRPGSEVVLGRIQSSSRFPSCDNVPFEQSIEIQKLRPGSGHLEVVSKMDGPIRTIQIHDVKVKPEDVQLTPDPNWNHASISSRMTVDEHKTTIFDDFSLKVDLQKGLGISVVTRQPCEELVFITLETIVIDVHSTRFVKSFDCRVVDLQIDNQLLDTSCPVLLHTSRMTSDDSSSSALILKTKLLPSPNKHAIIFEYLIFDIKPFVLILEERLILKVAYFLGFGKLEDYKTSKDYDYGLQNIEELSLSMNSRRFYFETLNIGSSQVRVSVLTAPKLTPELFETKKELGLTLVKFEDALIEFDKFSDKNHFEPLEVYLKAIKSHYVGQIKRHAASILGSVDFLGNPLGFANDLSEGVSGLIFEGSVKSLVKNVTHGISNSTAKLTETLSDSLGRVVLDEHDNEARQRILEIQSNTSGNHLAAGLKGLGFGLLGGVTSIVRQTYTGAQADGFPGLLSGFGKGLVGTVTKPIIGVLDLASETASAVRETSKTSGHMLPDRKRLPRCVTGAPGGLLPVYSYRQAKGQQYLYIINRRNFTEKLMSYEPNLCNDKDAKLRLLVTTEFIRIFSRCEEDPAIMFECHLSEVLSCHPLTTNVASAAGASSSKHMPCYYIEISTNLPKITRPRVKCQNEEVAERAARCVNYAKSVFDEREQSVTSE